MEQTSTAASSPAETDVFNGQQPTLEEFNQYRTTGEVPERFKAAPAESAPADGPEKTETSEAQPESAGESETPTEDQEHTRPRRLTAEQRRAQLRSAIEKLWEDPEPDLVRIAQLEATEAKIAERAEAKRKTESAPVAKPEQQTPVGGRPKPTPDGLRADGKPYATYEEYIEDLTDWKTEQATQKVRQQMAEEAAQKAVQAKLEEARQRYEDADDVIFPAAKTINESQISPVIKEVIGASEYFPDLCYVLGEDPEELEKFVKLSQSNPRAALAKVFEYERGIKEELSGEKKPAPEKRQTAAPKPVTPVGGSASRGFDVNDEKLSDDDWFKQRNKQKGLG